MNPEAKTPLNSMPEVSDLEINYFKCYEFISRPSRQEKRPIYPADISAAMPLYTPENPNLFAEYIYLIDEELWQTLEPSE